MPPASVRGTDDPNPLPRPLHPLHPAPLSQCLQLKGMSSGSWLLRRHLLALSQTLCLCLCSPPLRPPRSWECHDHQIHVWLSSFPSLLQPGSNQNSCPAGEWCPQACAHSSQLLRSETHLPPLAAPTGLLGGCRLDRIVDVSFNSTADPGPAWSLLLLLADNYGCPQPTVPLAAFSRLCARALGMEG